jgi:hypothetical protein
MGVGEWIAGYFSNSQLWKLRADLMLVFKNKTAAIPILSSKIAKILHGRGSQERSDLLNLRVLK